MEAVLLQQLAGFAAGGRRLEPGRGQRERSQESQGGGAALTNHGGGQATDEGQQEGPAENERLFSVKPKK